MMFAQVAQLSPFEELLQLTLQGLALGAVYALIALGFVIIYKATGVLNFAHGALMLAGTYLTFTLVSGQVPRVWPISGLGELLPFPSWLDWWTGLHINFRFPLALLLAVVFVALLGMVIERTALRKLVGQPIFAVVLVTLGLELVISTLVQALWNPQQKAMPTPFPATSSLRVGNLAIQWASVWAVIVMIVVVLGFFAFFKYSKYGVAMRATALDQEAALAMGIKASTVYGLAWALGGAMAAIAGAMFVPARLAGFLSFTTVRFSALNAFPAAILGGLDSPGGAVVGGLGIGVAQVLSARYINPILADLPVSLPNFHLVFPYVLMLLVLLIRPYGLFGTEEVRRV